jgi:hypothetical protein
MRNSIRLFPLVALTALTLAACDKNPVALRDPTVGDPFASALAAGGGSALPGVMDLGKLFPLNIIPGFPDLAVDCVGDSRFVAGVAFDRFHIYVAHGNFVNSCITRYDAATGAYMDQKVFRPDARGITWVPALQKLVVRTYGGTAGGQDVPAQQGRFFAIDYFAGTAVLLTNYDVQPCDIQGQPAVDPDGLGYWTNCGTSLEHHRMSDGALLSTIAGVTPFFPLTHPVIEGSGIVGLYSGAANQLAIYDTGTGASMGNVSTTSSNGCSGYGVGVKDLGGGKGALLGIDLDCTNARIETIGNQTAHGLLTTYPATPITSHIILCKDAASPAGSYGFAITASGIIGGDNVQVSATLSPGQCRIVFSRTAFSNITATLQITEVAPGGTVVQSITRTQLGTTTVFSGPSPTVTVSANSSHGGVVTYKNIVSVPIG